MCRLIKQHGLLISTLHRGERTSSRSGRFTREDRTIDIHWLGDGKDSKSDLEVVAKREVPSPAIRQTPVFHPIASLYTDWTILTRFGDNGNDGDDSATTIILGVVRIKPLHLRIFPWTFGSYSATQEVLSYYSTRKFITVITKAHLWIMPSVTSVLFTSTYPHKSPFPRIIFTLSTIYAFLSEVAPFK
jgi:hypothetical protein